MKIETLERTLVSLLRTELLTLKGQIGQTSEFIYVDYPRLDAKMPRISLTLSSSRESAAGIGAEINQPSTLGVMEETFFDIDIWVHRINKMTSPVKRGGTALRDYMGDEVVTVLLEKRKDLSNQGIFDVEKVGEIVYPYDEDTELFRKTLTFRVTHTREYPRT